MQEDAEIEQAGEGVALAAQDQQRHDDQHWDDFQQPGHAVIGLPTRDDQCQQGEQQQQDFLMGCHKEPVMKEKFDFMV
ncbi:hypothetical protein D3C80_2033770 [compost metagenome]